MNTPTNSEALPLTNCSPSDYDAGLLNDFGGGDVGWWQDYLRAEIGRANDYWRDLYERERDEARSLHAYASEQRKAADHERMNAEETVVRLRARVDDLLKHGQDACEYTDGWDDALLKVRDEFPPENAGGMAPGSAVQKPELENELDR